MVKRIVNFPVNKDPKMQERFWLESEVNHATLWAWWRGFTIGFSGCFAIMVLIGLYL